MPPRFVRTSATPRAATAGGATLGAVRAAVLAALFLACPVRPSAALEAVDLPLEHWAYEMLERFEVRAGLDRSGLDIRPLRRGAVAALVRTLVGSAARGDWSPSAIEQRQLLMLQHEFSAELAAQGDSVPVFQRAFHHWRGRDWEFQLEFAAAQATQHASTSAGFVPTDALIVFAPTAELALHRCAAVVPLDLVWRTSDGSLRNSVDPRAGEAVYVFDPRDRFSFTRRVQPYVRYVHGPLLVDLGRERLRWGPGRQNAMLLGDGTPPLDLLRIGLDFGWLRFTHLAGQLRPAQLDPADPPLVQKYVAAHRLSLQPHRRLQLAVSEAVIYGDRGMDLAYLNPINVFFVTQANIGDRDNALASLDGRLLLPGVELYGELVVDDLNLRRGLTHFGNKLGVLGGFLWLRPLGADDWDVEGEWSWASQFTYTHQNPINRYEHYGQALGSIAGPDADLWRLRLRRRLSAAWAVAGLYELERHGEGSLAVDQDDRTSETQDYLSGTVQSAHRPGLQVEYRGLRNLEVAFDARWVYVTHPGHDAARAAEDGMQIRALTRVEF